MGVVRVVLIPVVDHDHVPLRQPHGAGFDVVEDNAGAVDSKDGVLGGGEVFHVRVTLSTALAHADCSARTAPRAERAALMEGRWGGHSRDTCTLLRGGHRGGRAVQGHAHEGVGGRQENGGCCGSGYLQDRAGCNPVAAQSARTTCGHNDAVRRRIVDDGFVAHGRDRQVIPGGDSVDRLLRGGPCGPGAADCRQGRVLRSVGEHRSRRGYGHDSAGKSVGDRLRIFVLEGVRVVGVAHPQIPG